MVDYFSKWIELVKLPNNPTSKDLINHFTDVFARFWFPNISFSDREPIYKSTEMKQFCEMYGISKNFSSAYHSQSNGQVERAVGHIKNLIKRCNGNILKVKLCLLDYHATPLDSNLGRPHSILMNRNVRTRIPMLEKNLITKTDQDNREILLDRHQKGANYYNKTASDNVKLFKPSDIVVYRNGTGHQDDWKQAKVIAVDQNLRSYYLLNRNGNVISRNCAHMLPDKTGKRFQVSSGPLLDPIQQPYPTPPSDRKQSVDPKPSLPKTTSNSPSNYKTPPSTCNLDVSIPKQTIPPDQMNVLRAKYLGSDNLTSDSGIVLRRSARLAAKKDSK